MSTVGPVLDQLAEQHENALVARAPGLRHVVRDDDDRVAPAQRVHQPLDGAVPSASSAEHGSSIRMTLRLERQQPRDAQLLLLLEREGGGLAVQAVLHVVPERHLAQGRLHQLVQCRPATGRVAAACTRRPNSTFS